MMLNKSYCCFKAKCLSVVFLAGLLCFAKQGFTETLVEWDFSNGLQGWVGNAQTDKLQAKDGIISFVSIGSDAWIEGPPADIPQGKRIIVTIQMKSAADTSGQLFYGPVFTELNSERFKVQNDNKWHEYSFLLSNKTGTGTRFRLDPCTAKGNICIRKIKVEIFNEYSLPQFDRAGVPVKEELKTVRIISGDLAIEHYLQNLNGFVISAGDKQAGCGYEGELIGFDDGENAQWINLKDGKIKHQLLENGKALQIIWEATDKLGGDWSIERLIRAKDSNEVISIENEISCSKDRNILRLPWVTILAGLGTFGEKKHQGLFAGVEYLDDEPSSSEADIAAPKNIRNTPDATWITIPLMVIQADHKYVGIIWDKDDLTAATFDSPDRIYGSKGHLMSLSAPGIGELRKENSYIAYKPFKLAAGKTLRKSVLIIGGKADSAVEGIKQYVKIKGLPDLPKFGSFEEAVNLLGKGWTSSKINEGGLFRHAVWFNSFKAGPAADAVIFMDWLANQTEDTALKKKLLDEKDKAISKAAADITFASSVGHVRLPTAPLVMGNMYEYVKGRKTLATQQLKEFDEKGIKYYSAGGTDYAKTHFAKHANGYSANVVADILESALLSGDIDLCKASIDLLNKQTTLYSNSVPRGAQTWELALHTPDILASAHLVKAYTLGYIISGQADHLEQARYWAWTGLPFVYLNQPTDGPIGKYTTIAVYGATNWQAPVWFGRPVQWCGLVYASSLHLLSQYDNSGPWSDIAKGITSAGLQLTWPDSDQERVGLLPDFFELKEQLRAGPAINPGTVEAHVAELYGRGKLYDLKKIKDGMFIHAPCEIKNLKNDQIITADVEGWGNRDYQIVISGMQKAPQKVTAHQLDSKAIILGAEEVPDFEYHSGLKLLVIKTKGHIRLKLY